MKIKWVWTQQNVTTCSWAKKKRKKKEYDTFDFENISIKISKELIIGLTIDNKHSFINHVKKSRKAKQKICVLSRISNYLDSKQKEIF